MEEVEKRAKEEKSTKQGSERPPQHLEKQEPNVSQTSNPEGAGHLDTRDETIHELRAALETQTQLIKDQFQLLEAHREKSEQLLKDQFQLLKAHIDGFITAQRETAERSSKNCSCCCRRQPMYGVGSGKGIRMTSEDMDDKDDGGGVTDASEVDESDVTMSDY